MTNRTLIIGAAVVVALLGLVFVGWHYQKRTNEQAVQHRLKQDVKRQHDQALLTLHTLRAQADRLGIDTTRFTADTTATNPQLADKSKRLALEIRYGKKPTQLRFIGLRETLDTTLSTADLAAASTFAPYNQLIAHYERLRAAKAPRDTLRLIRQTLNFYRYLNRFAMDKFMVVNIPSGELTIFDRSGKRMLPMRVVVGKSDRKTPCMATYVNDIVSYPYWNVPTRIATEELLPRIQNNVYYLQDHNMELLNDRDQPVDPETVDWAVMSETNFPYRIRQRSGCDNSLGLLKFNLVNPYIIYLHDTDNRTVFNVRANARMTRVNSFRSHGCVRVQKPVELANFVLGAEVFDKGYMEGCLDGQKPRTIRLPKKFPVFIVYNTADVDADGKLQFYDDIYALNK